MQNHRPCNWWKNYRTSAARRMAACHRCSPHFPCRTMRESWGSDSTRPAKDVPSSTPTSRRSKTVCRGDRWSHRLRRRPEPTRAAGDQGHPPPGTAVPALPFIPVGGIPRTGSLDACSARTAGGGRGGHPLGCSGHRCPSGGPGEGESVSCLHEPRELRQLVRDPGRYLA